MSNSILKVPLFSGSWVTRPHLSSSFKSKTSLDIRHLLSKQFVKALTVNINDSDVYFTFTPHEKKDTSHTVLMLDILSMDILAREWCKYRDIKLDES